jgi:cellulose synthase/poly-beta-1,6-N-acetylglucosamine synthase-like glycosyltransferase
MRMFRLAKLIATPHPDTPSKEIVLTIRCSVGVTAHNEQANIGKLLDRLVNQELSTVEIPEIIVVASGCTDRTVEIIEEWRQRDPRIRLLVQHEREGKPAAVSLFIQNAHEDICVLESGDTVPGPDTIERLVAPFADPQVGMTGAQKIPVNAPDDVVGYLSHLRLRMEHELCLEIPRLGELVAFRKVFDRIPPDVAMDEAFAEALVVKRGMSVHYVPEAKVYNMGPSTVSDFIRQRRRNYAGHLHLKRKYGYRVSSLDSPRVLRIALDEVWKAIRVILYLIWLASLEGISRVLGAYDYYVRGRKHVVWDIAWTTKDVDLKTADAGGATAKRG